MGMRRRLVWPDPRLNRTAVAVSKITGDTRVLWKKMIDTMEAMTKLSLAAPQITKVLHFDVIDALDALEQTICIANSEVLHVSFKLRSHKNTCPNLTKVSAQIKQPHKITGYFLDFQRTRQTKYFAGLWATSLRSHLVPLIEKMYSDRLLKTRCEMLLCKARNMS